VKEIADGNKIGLKKGKEREMRKKIYFNKMGRFKLIIEHY
jgi:hypothetical protein